jgi:hypothetical protein
MIKRQQFTAWNGYQLPQFNNPQYLEYERVKSGISEEICTYGYFDTDKKTWVKLSEVKK